MKKIYTAGRTKSMASKAYKRIEVVTYEDIIQELY